MEDLSNFLKKVENFFQLSPGKQIKYFVYYLQSNNNHVPVKAKDIKHCFDQLHINAHTNIPMYLSRASKKGSAQEFIAKTDGYLLLLNVRNKIETEVGTENNDIPPPTDSLYPLAIFEKTPSYLIAFAEEACSCYDYKLYNSCLFMLRKICETLIIEVFESKGLESKIKTTNGDYFQLADLIKAVTHESTWKLSKIVKENLPKIKLLADSSVHSKRFKARKSDIDPMKTDLRIIFEEFVILIDYPIVKQKKA